MAKIRITVDAIVEIANPSSIQAAEDTLADVVETFVRDELLDQAAQVAADGRDVRAFEAASEIGVELYSVSADHTRIRKGPPAKGS